MDPHASEEKLLQKAALQNARSILQARLKAEQELRAANEELARRSESLVRSLALVRATLESTADAILATDAGGAITDYNEQLLEVFGLAREELDELDLDGLLARTAALVDDPAEYLATARRLSASDAESADVLELADGRVVERVTRPQTINGDAVGRVWSFRDVTERRRAHEELAIGHARFAAIVDQSPVGILLVDAELRIRHANVAALPALPQGMDPAGAPLGEVLRAQWSAELAAELEERFRQTLATGEPFVARDFTAVRRDLNVEEHYEWQLHRLTLPAGELGVACYFLDVTQHAQAREAARESAELVQATFDQAAVGIAIVDLGGRFTQVNRKLAQVLGYTEDELRERSIADVTHPEDREQTRTGVRRLLEGAVAELTLQKCYVRKDGTVLWGLATVAPLKDADGRVRRLVGVIEDITLRKHAEEAIREGAQRLQLALSAGTLGDWSWDAASDVVTLGARAAEIFGLPADATITWTRLRELLHADDQERARLAVEAAIRDRIDYDIEYRVDRPSGERCWVAAKGRGLYTEDGRNVGMIGVVQDVTERRRLADLRGRLAAIVETSEDAIVSKDLDGTIRTWNTGAERVFGWTADEIVGKSILRLVPPDLADEERIILGRLRAGERIEQYETERVRKDGTRFHVSLSVAPVVDASGRIVGASKIARDITAWKHAEAALRRSEEELRALADSIPQLAWMARPDGELFWFNHGWYEYSGTALEEMEGWGWLDVVDPGVRSAVEQRWRESLRTGERFEMEFPLRAADGSYRWFLTRVNAFRDEQGRVVRWFGTNTDVDTVKRAQEALREESRVLNLLNETGTAIAADLDLPTLLQTVTDAATQLSGAAFGAFFYNMHGEAGDGYQLYALSGAPREAFERFGQPRATPLFGPTFRGERPIRLDDVTQDPRYGRMPPHHGMPEGHLPVKSYLAIPVNSRGGEVVGGLFFGHPEPGVFTPRIERVIVGIAAQAAVAIDNARLYERVKRAAEDRKLLLDAERSARTEAERISLLKDEFLATLSHELRTPLNAIVGWTQVLSSQGDVDADIRHGLQVIDRNAKVQAQLIEDLLDMSRIISGKVRLDVQQVDLQEVVRAAIASVQHSADAKSIRLQAVLDPGGGPVRGDPGRLQQCFWNLLSNAIKFTRKGGRVQVSLQRVNSHLEVKVADDGQGIEPAFLPHVFERFRQADASTTRQHGGLGIGLSIVKSLVELHGGTVRAHSAGKEQGATFSVELPVMVLGASGSEHVRELAGAPLPERVPLDHPSLEGIRVLAVDDEPDARALVKRILEDCGAEVLIAETAEQALELVRRERPDMIVSDIGMPGEDGYQLIRAVRKLSPAEGGRTPAAALSAFARAEDRTRSLRAGYQTHLVKPVEPTELTAVIASLATRR